MRKCRYYGMEGTYEECNYTAEDGLFKTLEESGYFRYYPVNKDELTFLDEGKLYEMPNTVVHLKTQEEYDEYMDMCEEVGWKWLSGHKPKEYGEYYRYVRVEDEFTHGLSFIKKTIITLSELKQKIGREERKEFNLPIDTHVDVGDKYQENVYE
jgi:hypothetical protein